MKFGKKLKAIIIVSTIVIIAIIAIFPVYWIIVGAFKTSTQLLSIPPKWVFQPRLDAFEAIFKKQGLLQNFINSLVIATCGTVLSVTFGSVAGYSFARFKFKGSTQLPLLILAIRMAPPIALLVPLFMLLNSFKLLGTYVGIILPYTAFQLPFVTWLMFGFFKGLPQELEQAALIDGCSWIGSFIRITVPLAAPGLVAVSILSFVGLWNEFMLASILTRGTTQTLPVRVGALVGQYQTHLDQLCAMAAIVIIPVVIFTVFAQKYIVKGLAEGALKG